MEKITKLTLLDLSHEKQQDSTIYLAKHSCKRCFYCTLDILDESVGCPIKHVESHQDIKHNEKHHTGEYITYGTFCSYNCAKAYAIEKHHDPLFVNSCRYINMIVNKNKKNIEDVIPSPDVKLLSLYGGYMTEDQYKSEMGKILYQNIGITYPVTLVYSRKI